MNKRIKKKKGLAKITDKECWSLDVTLAEYIIPRLKKYKEVNTMSYPGVLSSLEEWHDIIDKMIWSFERVLKPPTLDDFENKNNLYSDKYNEGMLLFAEYFVDLWY